MAGLKPLEERFRRQRLAVQLHLEVQAGTMSIGSLQTILGWRAARIKQLMVKSGESGQTETLTLVLGAQPAKDTDEMIRLLSSDPSVVSCAKAE